MSQTCPRMFSALFQFLTGEHGLRSLTCTRTKLTPDNTVCVYVHGGGDESACKPDSVPVARERPSICDCRCRQPDAAHPRTWAGSPQTFAQPMPGTDLLALLQVGFTEPPGSPRTLVVSYTTVSPLPVHALAVCSLWHCPAGHPGSLLTTTLPCGARTFLGDGVSPADATAQPTRPS